MSLKESYEDGWLKLKETNPSMNLMVKIKMVNISKLGLALVSSPI